MKVVDRYTSAPPLLSESDLIGLMESNSIGTDASMATHISNVIERNYAVLDPKTRKLHCSELGTSLIEG